MEGNTRGGEGGGGGDGLLCETLVPGSQIGAHKHKKFR